MNKYRKAIFLVVYRKENGKIKYLLLKRKLHWKGWEFTKGGVEKNEKEEETALRELKEETGLTTNKLLKFKDRGKYLYDRIFESRKGKIGQTWRLFACEVESKKVKYDKKEHSGYKWMNFKQAYERLTWDNQKKCLKIINNLIG